MENETRTQEADWYTGSIKKSHNGYVFESDNREIELGEENLAEQVWEVIKKDPQQVMLFGELESEESLTGTENYEMPEPERAGYILDPDYSGRTVVVSGFDLLFIEEDDEIEYQGDSHEELRNELKGWFDDEKQDEYLEKLTELKQEEYWPWEA